MTTQEIKTAVDNGKTVHWQNGAYVIVKDKRNEYYIKCLSNNHCIGLTWADDVTLNGKEEDFYVDNETKDSFCVQPMFNNYKLG